jgi:type VI secretion system protein ImpK
MLEQMYGICAEALTFASQVVFAQELAAPDILRQRINTLFANISQRARQVGIPDVDVKEVVYALAAFIDEQIYRSQWSGRQQWMAQPLQLLFFNENTAGEGFFRRLSELQQIPGKEHVVQIYYLCLALGFQGKFGQHGTSELGAVQEHARSSVLAALPPTDTISPAGYPRGMAARSGRRRSPFLAIGAAVLGLAVLLLIVLKFTISASAANAADEISKASPASSS